jgi:P-type Mg2+ transporter
VSAALGQLVSSPRPTVALPFTPAAHWLGFTPLPPLFFGALLTMIVAYLGLVEVVKRWFYRRYPM